jgi:uncharacterized membrane protein YeaQ/YmgE (transglycosylase-associated protein family)
MTLWQYLGLSEFPWTTILIWGICGLIAGMVIGLLFWGRSLFRTSEQVRFGLIGALVGGFLGLCYHVLFGVSRFGLQ